MSFFIRFTGDDDYWNGSIMLGGHLEYFHSSTDHYSRDQYEHQWVNALRMTLEERRTTALFQNVEIDEDGVGRLGLYRIIASEFAGNNAYQRLRLSDFPMQEDEGVFIGEQVMNVAVDASNCERRIYTEFEDGSKGDEIALYYLDLSAPERFFGYLDDKIADVAHWYYPNSDLKAFIATR